MEELEMSLEEQLPNEVKVKINHKTHLKILFKKIPDLTKHL